MKRVYLGLGSNCEPRLQRLRFGLEQLRDIMDITEISPLYESPAMLPENAPDSWDQPFYNGVVAGLTGLAPNDLLEKCQQIEQQAGRAEEHQKWSPRELDIDILDMEYTGKLPEGLNIPHPGITERAFVFLPFHDIAPDHILQTRSVGPIALRELVASTESRNGISVHALPYQLD